jgi:hypothetical protein
MKAIVWLTQAQGFFVARPRVRTLNIASIAKALLVSIDGQKCAMRVDAFNDWRIGLLNLGGTVGSMHWLARRQTISLQRLRHHVATL